MILIFKSLPLVFKAFEPILFETEKIVSWCAVHGEIYDLMILNNA